MLTVKDTPLDSITLREEFERHDIDSQKQAELAQSIKAKGILYPLICMETPDGLTLVAGYRRYHAALYLGLATVPCICLNVGIDDAEILRLHENLYREDISPQIEAEAMDRLERTYHFTRSKIAQLLGKSPSYVTQRLQILSWPVELKRALHLNHISYSVARELSSVTDEGQLHSMIEQIVTSGASVRVVATWVQELKASSAIKDQIPIDSTPTAEPKPTLTDPVSCFTCGLFISGDNQIRIDVCPECLEIIKDLKS